MEPIKGYRLVTRLGSGSFGQVWEASVSDGTNVALKFLPCGSDAKARLENQAIQNVRQLQHPNLVRIDQVWAYDGHLILAMELADGSLFDLHEVYHSELQKAIDRDHLLQLLAQAAAGLDFLNSRQHLINGQLVALQHCDVNPNNMLLFGDTLKLSDFSLTSVLGASLSQHRRAGTMAFAAPEVFLGKLSDRTDQYALAVTYCYLRGGRLPFGEPPPNFAAGYVRPPADLSMLPEGESQVVAKALAPLPMDRYRWCGEFMGELEKAVKRQSSPRLSSATISLDRRDVPRHGVALRAVFNSIESHAAATGKGQVQNLSATGISMLLPARLKSGVILALRIEDQKSHVSRPLLAKVVHSVERAAGDWSVGCSFVNRLTTTELQALL